MAKDDIILLTILSPEKKILEALVSKVELPGGKGRFTVLRDHAPVISSLTEGVVSYVSDGKPGSVRVKAGFVEIKENMVTVCAEVGI